MPSSIGRSPRAATLSGKEDEKGQESTPEAFEGNPFALIDPHGAACCILCCMSAIRTQVYLTDDQRRRIDALADAEGVTMAEIIRRALDVYIEDQAPDPRAALVATFGAAVDATVPGRDEWHRG